MTIEFVLLCDFKYSELFMAHFWYRDGKLHREGGPAAVFDNESQYYLNGQIIKPSTGSQEAQYERNKHKRT